MSYQEKLDFLIKLLKGMNINSCVITNPSQYISPDIDMGLRKQLFDLENYVNHLENSMLQAKENTIYRFFDEYDCNFIFLRLPDKTQDSFFFVGPYLLDIPSEGRLQKRAEFLDLNEEQNHHLHLYYSNLPLIEDENILLTMANTLGKELWGEEPYEMDYVEYAILDRQEPIPSAKNITQDSSTDNLLALEENYASENALIDAVSKGKLHLVTAVSASVFNNGSTPLLSDSLRTRKNNLIILKTLLRKAAEYGGVHPFHIDKLSNHFTRRIEDIRSLKESLRLQDEMIRRYCNLVKQHSLKEYSHYVGQVITMVQYDLTGDLRLKTIAGKLNVNPSYLSNLFHKEYGCTLTEFITRQRIDYAIAMLTATKKSVQEIAAGCGIPDTNYFIKLFKKQTGMTPNKYRESMM